MSQVSAPIAPDVNVIRDSMSRIYHNNYKIKASEMVSVFLLRQSQ